MTYLRRPGDVSCGAAGGRRPPSRWAALLGSGILVNMAKGTVSPVFAGREDELAVLADAFSAAVGRTPGIVLVGADAGRWQVQAGR